MKMKFYSLMLISICLIASTHMHAQQLAFPGADGFAKYTTGGRGGTVYHVTNLNDSGPGSFRDAVSQSNRIVVFDVGGVINISSRIVIKRNITIAGQTAPGGGITIYGNGIALNGDSGNDIIQYIRIRMGKNGDSGKDAVGISDGQNYLFDHVSVSWGRDGTFDVNGSAIDNITLQDCIVSQGINNSNHSTGGLMQSGHFSVIRSLYIDNKTRNPKARGPHEFINSVLYNWGSNGYIMGDTEGTSECNLIGNYFIYGPSSSSGSHITRTTPTFYVYAHDNWVDSNKDGEINGALLEDYNTATVMETPFGYPGANTVLSADVALKHVIQNAGASLVRDEVDQYLIDELTSYGTKGQIVNTEDDNGISGGVGSVDAGTTPTDTDQDGMPDDFEDLIGYDKTKADNNEDKDNDGYTNIEEYFSCLTCECDVAMPNCPVLKSGTYTITSEAASLCIANDGANAVIQTECNETSFMGWNITEVNAGEYLIQSFKDQQYLTYFSDSEGSKLLLTAAESSAKRFSLEQTESLDYKIAALGTSLYITSENDSNTDGSSLVLSGSNSSNLMIIKRFEPIRDCAGVIDGEAKVDGCGVCYGGTTGIEACAGGIGGEDFCSGEGVFENTNSGFIGSGYFNFDNEIGTTGTYVIYAQSATSSELSFRYANGGSADRPVSVSVNGTEVVASLSFPPTDGWTDWQESKATISLKEGENTIILTALEADGGPNLDLMAFDDDALFNIPCDMSYSLDCNGVPNGEAFLDECEECVGGNTGAEACVITILSVSPDDNFRTYPNPFNQAIEFANDINVTISVTDLSGKTLIEQKIIEEGKHQLGQNWEAGIYFLSITDQEGNQTTRKLIKTQ